LTETRTGQYDAVVLGARGLGRIGALLGSVSQYVLHHAEIPVIVVHAPPARPDSCRGRQGDAGG